MVTIKKTPTEDTRKKMRKEPKHITIKKKKQYNTEEDSKIRKDAQKSCKTY